MRLTWMPLKSKLQIAVSSECCRRLSCGRNPTSVLPRARLPRLRIAPACSSSVSTSEVLPAPACPTSAMLRMPDVVYPMADAPRHVGPAPHEHHRYGKSLLRKGCPRLLAARTMQGKMRDRKSTRLNSSHSQISYAVFCLKKKKKTERVVDLD